MSTLITGGAGLLGATVVRQLLELGEKQPIVLDIAQSPERLQNISSEIEYIEDDFSRDGAIAKVIAQVKPDRIFHLGAMLGQTCENNPRDAMRVNVTSFFDLLDAARNFGVSQVMFASSVATFGYDMSEKIMRDNSLQRPLSFYGVAKLFGEGAGLFFKRKYGLDFRSLRYPFIVGPGIRVGGVIDYPTAMIANSLQGHPYTANVSPETRIPVLYIEDAARALLELAAVPSTRIKTVNYLVDGVKPAPSAGMIAAMVKEKVAGAQIDFQPDTALEPILEKVAVPIDDSCARQELGWQPEYDYPRIIDNFLRHSEVDNNSKS